MAAALALAGGCSTRPPVLPAPPFVAHSRGSTLCDADTVLRGKHAIAVTPSGDIVFDVSRGVLIVTPRERTYRFDFEGRDVDLVRLRDGSAVALVHEKDAIAIHHWTVDGWEGWARWPLRREEQNPSFFAVGDEVATLRADEIVFFGRDGGHRRPLSHSLAPADHLVASRDGHWLYAINSSNAGSFWDEGPPPPRKTAAIRVIDPTGQVTEAAPPGNARYHDIVPFGDTCVVARRVTGELIGPDEEKLVRICGTVEAIISPTDRYGTIFSVGESLLLATWDDVTTLRDGAFEPLPRVRWSLEICDFSVATLGDDIWVSQRYPATTDQSHVIPAPGK
jgi:hypothetical protein